MVQKSQYKIMENGLKSQVINFQVSNEIWEHYDVYVEFKYIIHYVASPNSNTGRVMHDSMIISRVLTPKKEFDLIMELMRSNNYENYLIAQAILKNLEDGKTNNIQTK